MRSLPRSHQQIRLVLLHSLLISGYGSVLFYHWSHFWSPLSQSFHLLTDRPVHMWSRILSGNLWIHGFQWLLLRYHMVFLKLQESHLPDVSLLIMQVLMHVFHMWSAVLQVHLLFQKHPHTMLPQLLFQNHCIHILLCHPDAFPRSDVSASHLIPWSGLTVRSHLTFQNDLLIPFLLPVHSRRLSHRRPFLYNSSLTDPS